MYRRTGARHADNDVITYLDDAGVVVLRCAAATAQKIRLRNLPENPSPFVFQS